MPIETRSFLRDRARTEDRIVAGTGSGPAAWSHSHLARLYRERCVDSAEDAAACDDCDMGAACATPTAAA